MSDPVTHPATDPTSSPARPRSGALSPERIKRISLYIALGTIVVGAVLAIVWLLMGSTGGVIGRAFLTLALLVAFAFAVLGEASRSDHRHPVVTLLRILILTATVGAGLWLTWGDEPGWWAEAGTAEEDWGRFLGWLAVAASLQAAGGLVSLAGWWVLSRSPSRAWSATMLAGSVLALGAFVMLAIPCTFQSLDPDDFYWRLVAAFGIAAVTCVIVPLTAIAMTRPKAPRPPRPAPEGLAAEPWTAPAGPAAQGLPGAAPVAPFASQPVAPAGAISIVGLVLAILLAPVGLIVSIVALLQGRREHRQTAFATAGVVVGSIITAFVLAIAVPATVYGVQSSLREAAQGRADTAAEERISALIGQSAPDYADATVAVSYGYATVRLDADPADVAVHDYAAIVKAIAAEYQDQVPSEGTSTPAVQSLSMSVCASGGACDYAQPPAAAVLMADPGWADVSYDGQYFDGGDFAAVADLTVPSDLAPPDPATLQG